MRHRDAGHRRHRHRRRDARHDLDIDAGGSARRGFLATTAEDERVATLQAHHPLAAPRSVDQQLVDLLLRHCVRVRRFAGIDHFDVVSELAEQLVRRQSIHHDDIGSGEQLPATGRDQAGVAGAATDERHVTRARTMTP